MHGSEEQLQKPASRVDKSASVKDAAAKIHSGAVIMIGDFMGCGAPGTLGAEMINQQIGELEVIANGIPSLDRGIGRMASANLIKRIMASYIAPDTALQEKIQSGGLRVDIVPQGTLAERIRCGGAGLGGFLTRTGIGTSMADNKQIIESGGETYLLETPLKADVALISAFRGDTWGNLTYRGRSRNLNPVMATAATIVIAEVEELYTVGDLHPNDIETPGIYVDMVVQAS